VSESWRHRRPRADFRPRSASPRLAKRCFPRSEQQSAPLYGAEHCAGATHAGGFVVHRDSAFARLADLRGCNFVYNSRHSNSRMNLPRRAIAEIVQGERFFGSITETHSQPGKIERVARADGPASTASPTRFSAGIVRSSAS
jgi:hypothetical protein